MYGNNGSVLALWLGGAAMSRLALRRPEFLGLLSTAATPSPILYLDGEGVVIADKSPSGRTLAVGAGATISTAQAAAGVSSIDFNNSTTGRIGVTPAISIPSTQGFTLEVRVRPRSLPQFSAVLEIGNHLGTGGIVFLLAGQVSGRPGPCIYTGAFYGGGASLPLNVWSKIRYVITTVGPNRMVYVYVNDVLESSSVILSAVNITGANTIGGSGVSFPTSALYFVNGWMDELYTWNEALLLP
jgi:hypothetical protein